MKITSIEATTLPDAWYQLLYHAVDDARIFTIDRGSYAGQKRLEFDFVVVRIKYPGTEPLLPSMPESSPIPPPADQAYLDDYLPYLMSPALKPNESYTYGQRLTGAPIDPKTMSEHLDKREIYVDAALWTPPAVQPTSVHFEYVLSQLDLLIATYKKFGMRNNQMCLQIAQPTDMLLRDPPCLRLIDTRIQDGKLHFFPHFRSWDLFNGFSANLAGVERMKQYLAAEIGVENGEIIATSKGLHLYDHVWEIAETLRGKKIAAREG